MPYGPLLRGRLTLPAGCPAGYAGYVDSLKHGKVLIIDEHDDVRPLLARRLSSTAGLRVVADTGSLLRGAELAARWQPDVILMDVKIHTPYRTEMWGRIALASPRSLLVVFTSYLDAGEKQAWMRVGVRKCLLKDIGMQGLIDELHALTRSREGGRQEVS